MNKIKTARVLKPYQELVSTMSQSDILNGYFGGSNLMSEYLHDYSANRINDYVDQWLSDNLKFIDDGTIEFTPREIIDNPDCLIESAAGEFFSALVYLVADGDVGQAGDVEHIMRHAQWLGGKWGDWYLYAHQWSNACCSWFVVCAMIESEALEVLQEYFENKDEDMPEEMQYVGCIDCGVKY